MKSYSLVYWSGIDDETGAFKQIDCLINDETVKKLFEGKPKLISVIVDDGEQMLIQTDNINQIKQL
ncbi:hypothetical protein IGL01_000727 [Enterococcus sp. DIV0340]|uniref:hypothetical protein n=1 Tax=unclassified Enterococcus TaxID=2608891 RepID=UPI003D300B07